MFPEFWWGLGWLLVFVGVVGLFGDNWRRKAKGTEDEADRVREELERKRRELERQVEDRMSMIRGGELICETSDPE